MTGLTAFFAVTAAATSVAYDYRTTLKKCVEWLKV